jgi:hypothetical protein
VVEAFPAQVPMKRSAIAFARDARTGVRMMQDVGAAAVGRATSRYSGDRVHGVLDVPVARSRPATPTTS